MHKEEISRIEYVVVFFRACTVLVTWKVTWSKRYFWQIKWEHFSYVWNEFTEVRLRILNLKKSRLDFDLKNDIFTPWSEQLFQLRKVKDTQLIRKGNTFSFAFDSVSLNRHRSVKYFRLRKWWRGISKNLLAIISKVFLKCLMRLGLSGYQISILPQNLSQI